MARVETIADTMGGGQTIFGSYRACMPIGLNGYRLREVVTDYLEKLPPSTKDIFNGAMLTTMALAEKYPCQTAR